MAIQVLLVGNAVELENVEAFVSGNADKVRLGPVDLTSGDLDTTDRGARLPIVKVEEAAAPHSKKSTTVYSFGAVSRLDLHVLFLEVFVDLDPRVGFANSVLVRIHGPHKLQSASEALVTPSQRSVDDVLAVSANDNETTVGAVNQGLRVDFAAAKLLG